MNELASLWILRLHELGCDVEIIDEHETQHEGEIAQKRQGRYDEGDQTTEETEVQDRKRPDEAHDEERDCD